MAKTNVFMNWKNVTATPTGGGSAIVIGEVMDMGVEVNDAIEEWTADGNRFSTVAVVAQSSRGGTISGGDIAKLLGLSGTTRYTLVATLNDAYNLDGEGALTLTWTNVVFGGKSSKGPSNKFATGQVEFTAHSTDGDTDPLTIVQEPA